MVVFDQTAEGIDQDHPDRSIMIQAAVADMIVGDNAAPGQLERGFQDMVAAADLDPAAPEIIKITVFHRDVFTAAGYFHAVP